MKKKYIITFLFLLFLNINTTYAAEEYVFEVSRYGKATEDASWYQTFDIEKTLEEDNDYLYYQCTQNGQTTGIERRDTGDSNLIGDKVDDFLDCKSLFNGEEAEKLLELLKTAVTITKISIPLLLFGLGTLDFAKAIFAGSEDNMKKAQSKFIRRVMIAVCIFLIPTLIKLILTIASGIWGNISPDFCGIL